MLTIEVVEHYFEDDTEFMDDCCFCEVLIGTDDPIEIEQWGGGANAGPDLRYPRRHAQGFAYGVKYMAERHMKLKVAPIVTTQKADIEP